MENTYNQQSIHDRVKLQKELSDLLSKDTLGLLDKTEKSHLEYLIEKYKLKGVEREKIIARLLEEDPFNGYEAFLNSKFYKIQSRPRKISAAWSIYVAASIVILLAIGLWLHTNSPVQEPVAKHVIEPGRHYAMITMGNGQEMQLGETKQNIKECDGTIIRSDSGRLVYTTPPVNTPSVVYNTITIPRSGEYRLVLADGTQVWLNSETRLRFPVNFQGVMREVFLEGEAYFQVTKNETQSFIVHTSMGIIKVLGTSFNVRDYSDERSVVTTLVNGKISYTSNDTTKGTVILTPEFQSSDQEGGVLDVRKVNPFMYTGWKDGKFSFEECSLENIMTTLEKWYDINVVYIDPEIRELHFTGDLERYDNINTFLDFIETGGDVKFRIAEKTIYIEKK